jgi:hypothetical protein
VRRNIHFVAVVAEQVEESTARFASTPLVLESYPPDFSTEAGNSALIANNEILAQLRPRRKTKTSGISEHFRLAYQGGTPCHGTSLLADNSLLLPRCHRLR